MHQYEIRVQVHDHIANVVRKSAAAVESMNPLPIQDCDIVEASQYQTVFFDQTYVVEHRVYVVVMTIFRQVDWFGVQLI